MQNKAKDEVSGVGLERWSRFRFRCGVVHWVVMLGLVFFGGRVMGQNYEVKPASISATVDADTTFLVVFSTNKVSADFGLGNRALSYVNGAQSGDGHYRGVFSFSTAGNWNPAQWTLEMVARVPYSMVAASQINFVSWNSTAESVNFSIYADSGFGLRAKGSSWATGEGLFFQPYSGGNGRSIQASAPDVWVHLSVGFDFANQKALVVARDLAGNLLNRDIQFFPTPWLDTAFLTGLTAEQQSVELARRWRLYGERFARSLPSTLAFGNAEVDIKWLRLSRRYRQELFDIGAALPVATSTTWVPSTLDANRSQVQTVSRTVGYPGYNNFKTISLSEQYLPLAPGSAPISISLGGLSPGLYTLYVYGSVDPKGRTALGRVWKPLPLEFEARDGSGALLDRGRLLAKQSLIPRRVQGFSFHVASTGPVTATLRVPQGGLETLWVQKIEMVDQLEGLPDVAVKTSQTLAVGAGGRLASLTETRRLRDDAIWGALPPLNTQLQVHGQVSQFASPPSGVVSEKWVSQALQPFNTRPWLLPQATFAPLDFQNLSTSAVFPHREILAGTPWPGQFQDNGVGVFFSKTDYPVLATDIYNSMRAELLGFRYLLFAGAIMDSRGSFYGAKYPSAYFNGGGAEVGHDGAMALVRWAYDWPALEMSLHEMRLCTHSPDLEYNADWSSEKARNGKMYYSGWSGDNTRWLFEAYDQVFPYIQNNQVFAEAVRRFIPWVNTPQDVVRMLDRYLVFASVRDVKRGLIDGSVGVEDMAAQLLGPHPLTAPMLDLNSQFSSIYPLTGTYDDLYATALSSSGTYYIGSFMVYGLGGAISTVNKASLLKQAKLNGVALPMDLSDVNRFGKVRKAGDYLLDMWVGGGFPFMVGDASGGPHSGLEAVARLSSLDARIAVKQAFDLYGDARHAWVLKNLHGDTRPEVATAAQGISDPILQANSRVVVDYGAILELSPQQTNALAKTAATLRLGVGQGHAHNDYLDLNLFGMGLPLSVDLACRNEGSFWSRPSASWSYLHNHALAHDTDDPNGAGGQGGEPWLRAFAPPVMRASYFDKAKSVQLERDTIFMEVGDSGSFYAFDVQRLSGGIYHTWAFHGCESDDIALNVPMAPQSTRWIDRTLEGTQKVGTGSNLIQATWTMTRVPKTVTYSFNGGGTFNTVACEPTVLGAKYNASLPPVNVRATLLGRGGDQVLQGNAYSATYAYSLPYLWVQRTGASQSTYPAIYEWYRGGTPIVANAEILQQNPLIVRVNTTSQQVDTYEVSSQSNLAISRDARGVRWVKLSGGRGVSQSDVVLNQTADYDVTIVSVDYEARRLVTSGPLPADASVMAGNAGRRRQLQLRGSGTSFTWDGDLVIQQSEIRNLHVTGPNSIVFTMAQPMLFDGIGNRESQAMVVTTEDGRWHFRGGVVVTKPVGGVLTTDVFRDSNGDGKVKARTYEIGVGDRLILPVDVTLARREEGWVYKSNVSLGGSVLGVGFTVGPSVEWASLVSRPPTPGNVKVLTSP